MAARCPARTAAPRPSSLALPRARVCVPVKDRRLHPRPRETMRLLEPCNRLSKKRAPAGRSAPGGSHVRVRSEERPRPPPATRLAKVAPREPRHVQLPNIAPWLSPVERERERTRGASLRARAAPTVPRHTCPGLAPVACVWRPDVPLSRGPPGRVGFQPGGSWLTPRLQLWLPERAPLRAERPFGASSTALSTVT
jgi:hypothetical protein